VPRPQVVGGGVERGVAEGHQHDVEALGGERVGEGLADACV